MPDQGIQNNSEKGFMIIAKKIPLGEEEGLYINMKNQGTLNAEIVFILDAWLSRFKEINQQPIKDSV